MQLSKFELYWHLAGHARESGRKELATEFLRLSLSTIGRGHLLRNAPVTTESLHTVGSLTCLKRDLQGLRR